MSTVTAARYDLRASLQRVTDALCHASIDTAPLLWRYHVAAPRRQSTDPGTA